MATIRPFKYKDKEYTLQIWVTESQYSMANCGIVGLAGIKPYAQYIYDENKRSISSTYLGQEVERAFWQSDEVAKAFVEAFMEKFGKHKHQIFINDAVNYNNNYWHTYIMEWLRDNAEKHGGTIWAGPLSPNPNYTSDGVNSYHMTQCLIWIPNGVPTCTSRKSARTKKWYTNPSKEQVDKKILPKTRIYTKN